MSATSDPANYLAASGLIPVLLLADVVIRRRWIALGDPAVVVRLNRLAPWAEFAGAVLWGVFFGWAEYICLRSLQTGRSSFGGTAVVWIALGVLWLQAVGYAVIGKLGEALPSRFVERPPSEGDLG